jgi:hypothetical protein
MSIGKENYEGSIVSIFSSRSRFSRGTLQTLEQTPDGAEERLALHDASNILLALKREVLRFPYGRTG